MRLYAAAGVKRSEDMLYVATQGRRGTPPIRRSVHFQDSGYAIVRSGWGKAERLFGEEQYLIFDCGPLGAGNHGHFDCLSFELAAYGRSLIVDPGRYTYSEAGDINWRVRFRGTAYHNTVLVDGKNQTRYEPRAIKGASRHSHGSVRHKVTGPAPRHEMRRFIGGSRFDLLHGLAASQEYDALHERRIFFAFGEYWICCDTLSADARHRYDLLFHLGEQAQDRVAIRRARGTLSLCTPHLLIAQQERGNAVELSVEPGFVSYRYGSKQAAPIVRFTQNDRNAEFQTVLYPYRDRAPEITMQELTVSAEHARGAGARALQGANGAEARAFQIAIGAGDQRTVDYCFYSSGEPRRWRFGPYLFDGSYLLLRKNARGETVELHADQGAQLSELGPHADRGER